jgi:UDP-N-acetyl-2-amino-2-deoxyglucuronate dehydrogenase
MLRIGLIGCGERGASYPQAIAKAGNAQLAMVSDVNGELAQELGERLGLPWRTQPEDMLDSDEIDAVLVCTPHHVHAAQVIEAARHGKHVMVEKPLGTSMVDALAAFEATRAGNVCLSVVLQTRYQPQIQKARELIREGALGRLLGSSITYQHDKLLAYWLGGYTGRSRSDWRARSDTSGGGVLMHSAIHYLDWLGYLTGETIVDVSAKQATLDSPVEVEDTIAAWMRFENGALGSLHAATCVRGSHQLGQVELWGTDGQISLHPPYQFYSLRIVDGCRPGQWHQFGSVQSEASDSTEYFRRFADCVLAGKDAEISGEDALRLQAIVDAFYRSATEGKPVSVIKSQ